jgi:hypothetical protein
LPIFRRGTWKGWVDRSVRRCQILVRGDRDNPRRSYRIVSAVLMNLNFAPLVQFRRDY